jgi:hypothetical protein
MCLLVNKDQYVPRLFHDGSNTNVNLLPNQYRSILIHFKQKKYITFSIHALLLRYSTIKNKKTTTVSKYLLLFQLMHTIIKS